MPAEKKEVVESDVKCPKCGKTMVVKQGRFGPFLACPGYPKCKTIVNIDKPAQAEEELPPCPECGKPLKKITTRSSTFYGCTGYPTCKFTSSNKPIADKCPECGSFMVERVTKAGKTHACGNKECGYKVKVDEPAN